MRKDGTRFWASVVISPVYDESGRHVGFAKVTRDQTEQRRHEDERRTSLEQRIHLLAVTAHELRTPTAVIDGSAGALQGEWDQLSVAERDELLDGIRGSASRLRRLAADLGTASRVYSDALDLRPEIVSLAATLHDARRRGVAKGFEEPIEVEVTTETRVSADPVRLGQALDNLVENAARHGRPPIRLRADVDESHVRILVSDNGPGVPAELEPQLFERFALAGLVRGHRTGAAPRPRDRPGPRRRGRVPPTRRRRADEVRDQAPDDAHVTPARVAEAAPTSVGAAPVRMPDPQGRDPTTR